MGLVTHDQPHGEDVRPRRRLRLPGHRGPAVQPGLRGLQNQLYSAARQYQRYATNPTTTATGPVATTRSSATRTPPAARSRSTSRTRRPRGCTTTRPTSPNAAALDAGYGTGDGCSAYGNRNFCSYFTDWFGSTQSAGSRRDPDPSTWRSAGRPAARARRCPRRQCGLRGRRVRPGYQNGSIYWSPATGAAVCRVRCATSWWADGRRSAVAGLPGRGRRGPITGGAPGAFQGGSVYWSPAPGRTRWGRSCSETWWSAGGCDRALWAGPSPASGRGPRRQGRLARFQGGSIYWSAATGAHWLVRRDPEPSTEALGWTTGGWASRPVTRSAAGRRGGGVPGWHRLLVARHRARTPSRGRWDAGGATGWDAGSLGWPTADATVRPARRRLRARLPGRHGLLVARAAARTG